LDGRVKPGHDGQYGGSSLQDLIYQLMFARSAKKPIHRTVAEKRI
jgi:hypothetical protein